MPPNKTLRTKKYLGRFSLAIGVIALLVIPTWVIMAINSGNYFIGIAGTVFSSWASYRLIKEGRNLIRSGKNDRESKANSKAQGLY